MMIIRTANNVREVRDSIKVWLSNEHDGIEDDKLEQIIAQWLHYYRHDQAGFWLALDDDRIVGIATALIRPPQWMLVNFYVRPAYQRQGIGHALIKEALAIHAGCERFLVNASTHPAAQHAYLSAGMYPQPPSLWFMGKPKVAVSTPAEVSAEPCAVEDIIDIVNQLDARALGFTRAVDHRWLATWGAYFLLKAGAETVGYFRTSTRGAIGPLVTADTRWMPAALDWAILKTLELTQTNHQILVPGANATALAQLLRYGYRYYDIELLMSSHPLPDLSSAIFYDCDLL